MKICTSCNKEKSLTDFYSQNKKKADGTPYVYYNPKCKECVIKSTRQSQEKYKDFLVLYRKKRYRNKKDYYIERATKRYKINKDSIRDNFRNWQQNNKDKIKEYNEYRNLHKKHTISKSEWLACKDYFNNCCAYCGLHIDEHYKMWKGKPKQIDFHKEHVDHEGSNDLSNCVPSCQSCNSSKRTYSLEEWYNESNYRYSRERIEKIHNWLNEEYIKYIK